MPDDIDTLVTTAWPSLANAAKLGLQNDQIATYVPTELLTDGRPFQFAVTWEPAFTKSSLPIESTVSLATSALAVTPAHELRISIELGEDILRDTTSLVATVQDLSAGARRQEMATVFQILCDSPERALRELSDTKYGLDLAMSRLGLGGRHYRMIGDNDIAKYAKRLDLVDEVVPSPAAFPDGVVAMLIPTVGGPVLQRIAEDMSLSWRRKTSNTILLTVSERFFVRRASQVATFRS